MTLSASSSLPSSLAALVGVSDYSSNTSTAAAATGAPPPSAPEEKLPLTTEFISSSASDMSSLMASPSSPTTPHPHHHHSLPSIANHSLCTLSPLMTNWPSPNHLSSHTHYSNHPTPSSSPPPANHYAQASSIDYSSGIYHIPVPPGMEYASAEEALVTISSFTAQHGYALVKQRSVRKNGIPLKIFLRCDRGGTYTNKVDDQKRQRQRMTRKTGCPFSLVLVFSKLSQVWMVRVRNSEHNHAPSPILTHPSLRRLALSKKADAVRAQLGRGIPVRTIMTSLICEAGGSSPGIITQDIRNLRHRMGLQARANPSNYTLVQPSPLTPYSNSIPIKIPSDTLKYHHHHHHHHSGLDPVSHSIDTQFQSHPMSGHQNQSSPNTEHNFITPASDYYNRSASRSIESDFAYHRNLFGTQL